MSKVKYSVVYFWWDGWDLNSEVYIQNLDSVQEAEKYRSQCLEEDPDLPVQNLQVIQYDIN